MVYFTDAYLSTHSLTELTHWGRVMHICVTKLTTIHSDDGLSPDRCQAIIWTNAGNAWDIVNSNLRNKLQWFLQQNSSIFIQENAFENVAQKNGSHLFQPQYGKHSSGHPQGYDDVMSKLVTREKKPTNSSLNHYWKQLTPKYNRCCLKRNLTS